jgi:Bacterial Ig domain
MKGFNMTTRNETITPICLAARRRFMATSALALLPAALLSACGGGSGDPPTITLYASITGGAVGTSFSLSADADDDDGVTEVNFYRVTSNSEILLATFSSKPYLLQLEIPTGTNGTTIQYMARVEDTDEETTNSNTVSITVSA